MSPVQIQPGEMAKRWTLCLSSAKRLIIWLRVSPKSTKPGLLLYQTEDRLENSVSVSIGLYFSFCFVLFAPAFAPFPHQVVSLVSHLCLLPRPLVYIRQAFLMLVATLSGLVSEQWFSICGETCVLTFCFLFPGFWDFACMILYLCCDFCLSSFWFGLNKDRELLHLCAPASVCPPACEFLTNFTFLLKLKVLGRSSSAVWSCARCLGRARFPLKKNLPSSKHKHHHLLFLSTRLCSPAGLRGVITLTFSLMYNTFDKAAPPGVLTSISAKIHFRVNWFFTTAWRVLLEKKGTSNQRLEFRSWNNRNIFPTFLSGLLYSWSKWSCNLELERFHSWEMQHRLTHIKACVCMQALKAWWWNCPHQPGFHSNLVEF